MHHTHKHTHTHTHKHTHSHTHTHSQTHTLTQTHTHTHSQSVEGVVEPESGEDIPIKMLDCDSITQAKEKVLDHLYKNCPASKRPQLTEVDLSKYNVAELVVEEMFRPSVIMWVWQSSRACMRPIHKPQILESFLHEIFYFTFSRKFSSSKVSRYNNYGTSPI